MNMNQTILPLLGEIIINYNMLLYTLLRCRCVESRCALHAHIPPNLCFCVRPLCRLSAISWEMCELVNLQENFYSLRINCWKVRLLMGPWHTYAPHMVYGFHICINAVEVARSNEALKMWARFAVFRWMHNIFQKWIMFEGKFLFICGRYEYYFRLSQCFIKINSLRCETQR